MVNHVPFGPILQKWDQMGPESIIYKKKHDLGLDL